MRKPLRPLMFGFWALFGLRDARAGFGCGKQNGHRSCGVIRYGPARHDRHRRGATAPSLAVEAAFLPCDFPADIASFAAAGANHIAFRKQ